MFRVIGVIMALVISVVMPLVISVVMSFVIIVFMLAMCIMIIMRAVVAMTVAMMLVTVQTVESRVVQFFIVVLASGAPREMFPVLCARCEEARTRKTEHRTA